MSPHVQSAGPEQNHIAQDPPFPDYSLSNTVRNMLFLPCTRDEKYSAKQAIDSFFFRMGDVVSAAIVFAGTHAGLAASGFARLNVVLAAAFLGLAVLVGRAYVGRTPMRTVGGPGRRKTGIRMTISPRLTVEHVSHRYQRRLS